MSSSLNDQRPIPHAGRPRGEAWRALQREGLEWEGQILIGTEDHVLSARLVITEERLAFARGGEIVLDISRKWLKRPPFLSGDGAINLRIETSSGHRDRFQFTARDGREAATEIVTLLTHGKQALPSAPPEPVFDDVPSRRPARRAQYDPHQAQPPEVAPAPFQLSDNHTYTSDVIDATTLQILDTTDFPPVTESQTPTTHHGSQTNGGRISGEPITISTLANQTHRSGSWSLNPIPSLAPRSSAATRAGWAFRLSGLIALIALAAAFGADRLPDTTQLTNRSNTIIAPFSGNNAPTNAPVAQVIATTTVPLIDVNDATRQAAETAVAFGVGGETAESTSTPTDTATLAPTATAIPSRTATLQPTATRPAATATDTANVAAANPTTAPALQPTASATLEPTATATTEPTQPPTATETATIPATATNTVVPEPTPTATTTTAPTATATLEPIVGPVLPTTPAPTDLPTATPSPEPPTTVPTGTATASASATATNEPTATDTNTPEPTPTAGFPMQSRTVGDENSPRQVFSTGAFRYTIEFAERGAEIPTLELPTVNGSEWVVIVLNAQNWSDAPATLNMADFQLLVSGDFGWQFVGMDASSPDIARFLGFDPILETTELTSIPNGESIRLALVYLIPPTTTSMELIDDTSGLNIDAALAAGGDVTDLGPSPEQPDLIEAVVTDVIDGRTIVVESGGASATIQYLGIDVPTGDECYAADATDTNRNIVLGKTVYLEREYRNRVVAGEDVFARDVWIDNTQGGLVLVAAWMASEGAAGPAPANQDTRFAGWIQAAADAAQANNVGFWAACGTSPVQGQGFTSDVAKVSPVALPIDPQLTFR